MPSDEGVMSTLEEGYQGTCVNACPFLLVDLLGLLQCEACWHHPDVLRDPVIVCGNSGGDTPSHALHLVAVGSTDRVLVRPPQIDLGRAAAEPLGASVPGTLFAWRFLVGVPFVTANKDLRGQI